MAPMGIMKKPMINGAVKKPKKSNNKPIIEYLLGAKKKLKIFGSLIANYTMMISG